MLRAGAFQPRISTTGIGAPDVAKRARRVSDSPGQSVTSLSLHRIGTIGSPFSVRLIDTCWNNAMALEDAGTDSVTVATSSAPSCRTVARTSLVTVDKDCNGVKSAYCVSGVRYQFECAQSSSSVWVESH